MTRADAVILAIAATLVLTQCEARAHDWYPRECCSGQDCAPVDQREITEDGAWYVYRGIRFAKRDSKVSPDDRYHLCYVKSQGLGSQPFIRCLWRPSPGA